MVKFSERFWSKVNKKASSDCWEWQASRCRGYGYIGTHGKSLRAHRVAWTLMVGKIPSDKIVCHKCDNPSCVNPAHLFLGTFKENSQDMVKKGREKSTFKPSKLSAEQVIEIRSKYTPRKYSCSKLAKEYGVDHSMIWLIVKNRTWKN